MSDRGLKFLEEAEGRRIILGPGLRLTFALAGDRWTHTLAVGEAPGPVLRDVASTVEGDAERDDPARVVSPAYQEIQEHPIVGGVRLLLTGQSTPHHFSAVVTVRREGPGVSVEFDVADRCRRPVEALAATYLIPLGSGDLADAGPGRIVWEGDAIGGGRLEFTAEGPGTVALAEAGRRASRVQALAALAPGAATHRLLYRWTWTPPGLDTSRPD